VTRWFAHRDECKRCLGDAPLTYGPPCERKHEFVEHAKTCARCNPCPGLKKAIEAVVEWTEGRKLLSEAEWLRARLENDEAIQPRSTPTQRVLRLGEAGRGERR
jgi:hypothetical protein